MKSILVLLTVALLSACSDKAPNNSTAATTPKPAATVTATPAPSPSATIEDGDYDGKGVVTKINTELGSVELDHEEIEGLMPRMIMEFYVSDKKLLDGLKVGDKVDFTVRYKQRTETIVKIGKTK